MWVQQDLFLKLIDLSGLYLVPVKYTITLKNQYFSIMGLITSNTDKTEKDNTWVFDRIDQMKKAEFKFSCLGFGCMGTLILIVLIVLAIFFFRK